jgi:hypothetical protein
MSLAVISGFDSRHGQFLLWRFTMPELTGINRSIAAINDYCDENFHIVVNGDSVTLFNGSVEITEDWDYEIEARLLQIVKENGIIAQELE